MKNGIQESHRQEIIAHFKPLIEAGASKVIQKEARRQLIERFADLYSKEQVGAVCSQVIIQRNRTMQLLQQSPSASNLESGNVITGFNESNAVAAPLPEEATTTNFAIDKEKNSDTEEVPQIDQEKSKTDQVTGATFNYDNPEKNDWRENILMKYVCENVPPEQRPTKKILCFGGRENLEPKAYIRNGFLPENIVSIERDADVKDEFDKSALELGIRTFFGEITDYIPAQKFSIVSLDYTGPVQHRNFMDVSKINLDDDALVVMNFQKKRDSAFSKIAAKISQGTEEAFASMHPIHGASVDFYDTEQMANELERRKEQELSPEEWQLARQKLAVKVVNAFGIERADADILKGYPAIEKYLIGMRDTDESDPDEYSKLMTKFHLAFSETMEEALKIGKLNKMFGAMIIQYLTSLLALYKARPFIESANFREYVSKRNGKSNPFFTFLSKVKIPRKFYMEHAKTFREFAEVVEEMIISDFSGKLRMENRVEKKKIMGIPFEVDVTVLCYRRNDTALCFDFVALKNATAALMDIQNEHMKLSVYGDSDSEIHTREYKDVQNAYIDETLQKARQKRIHAETKYVQPRYRLC